LTFKRLATLGGLVAVLAAVTIGFSAAAPVSAVNCPASGCAQTNPYPCHDNPGAAGGWYEYAGYQKDATITAGTSGGADVRINYDAFPQNGHVAVWVGVRSLDGKKWIQAGVSDFPWKATPNAYVEYANGTVDANGNPIAHYVDLGSVAYYSWNTVVISHDWGTNWHATVNGVRYPSIWVLDLNFTGSTTQYTGETWQAQYSDGAHCQYLDGQIANTYPYTTGGMFVNDDPPAYVYSQTATSWSLFQR
jgi:hypothetical protein